MTTKETADFTTRTITALMTTLADHKDRAQQIEKMIIALAVAYGLPGILPDPAG